MVTTANNPAHCQAKNKKGQPCGGFAVEGSQFCYIHDPKRSASRAASRSLGGRARHGRQVGTTADPIQPFEPVTFATVKDGLKLLEGAINDTLKLENSLQRARNIGYLVSVGFKGFEISELRDRVEALLRALGEREQ